METTLCNIFKTANAIMLAKTILKSPYKVLQGSLKRTIFKRSNCRFYTNFAVFKIEICGTLFKRYLHENEALHTPNFYMKMNHFKLVFHMSVF